MYKKVNFLKSEQKTQQIWCSSRKGRTSSFVKLKQPLIALLLQTYFTHQVKDLYAHRGSSHTPPQASPRNAQCPSLWLSRHLDWWYSDGPELEMFFCLRPMFQSIHGDYDRAVTCQPAREEVCSKLHAWSWLQNHNGKWHFERKSQCFPPWVSRWTPVWGRAGGEQKNHESCSCLDPGCLVAMHSMSMDSLTNLQQSASHCVRESARAAVWVFHTWAMCHTVQHFWCNRGGGEKTSPSLCLTFFWGSSVSSFFSVAVLRMVRHNTKVWPFL